MQRVKADKLLTRRTDRRCLPLSFVRRFSILVVVLLMAGCADSSISDLQNFVSDVKSKKGKIEPVPEFPEIETFVYKSEDFNDPFKPWTTEVAPINKAGQSNNGIKPVADRPKEELEEFPLDTLRMMGTLEMKGVRWALIKASDGIVYRVKPGNYMGQNYGKIVDIQDDKVLIKEIVPNGLGGWEEREASLALNVE